MVKHRILLVDDRPIVCSGVRRLLSLDEDIEVCGEAYDEAGALQAIEAEHPDAVVVDVELGATNGLDLVRKIMAHDCLPILVLSVHDEYEYAERALSAGARGYVMKQRPGTELVRALRTILNGDVYMSAAIRQRS
jgi:DNA-binding NarL/FixJ family response regulator